MVATYLGPLRTALSVFPFLALVVMLPAAFVGYRRRGRAGGWTAVVFYTFVFYLLAIAAQTVLPLPDDPGFCSGHSYASSPQLRPFYFVDVVVQRARGHWSPGALLHNPAVWTTALNVAMLIPLGIFLRYALRMRVVPAVLTGFGLSLLFELTQLTGLWFTYPCPYRLFSVDDLLLNTAGALVGWLVAGPLGRVLPTLEPERERRRFAPQVTFTRRLFALVTDLLGFAALLGFLFGLLTLFGEDLRHRDTPVVILALVWFAVLPAVTGSTPGKRAMLLRVGRPGGRRAGPVSLLVRAVLLYSPLWLTWVVLDLDSWDLGRHPERLLLPVALAASVFVVLVWTPLAVLLDDEHRAPYERLTRTVNLAILPPPADLPPESVPVPAPAEEVLKGR